MPTEVEIMDARRVPSFSPDRMGKYDRQVLFKSGTGTPLLVVVPDEDFSEDLLKAAMERELAARGGLVGRKLTVG